MKLYLRIAVSLYLLLLLLAGTGYLDLWGIYHLSIFPGEVAVGIIVLALLFVWLPTTSVSWLLDKVPRVTVGRTSSIIILITCTVAAIVVFAVGRSENLLLGDGYKRIQMMEQPIDFWPTEYIDLVAHRLLYQLVGSAEVSYLITGVASGVVFLAAAYLFIRGLKADRTTATAAGLIIVGIAQMQFFFGYVESYAIMAALAALFLLFGYRYASGRKQFWLAMLFFVTAGIFHLSAWFFLPGMLYLLMLRGKRTGNSIYKWACGLIIVVALALATVYYFEFEGNRIFVPITAIATNPYSLFSLSHLFDIANELLLVAPLSLLLVLGVLVANRKKHQLGSPGTIFLSLCTLGGLLVLVAVDPILGAVRDWDLLSLYGLPLTFLAASFVRTALTEKRDRCIVVAAAAAILLAHSVPWIVSNTKPVLAKDLMKRAIVRDVHYTPEYYEGYLLKQWGFYVENKFRDYEETERSARLRIEADPDDPGAYMMYALACYFGGEEEQLLWALNRIEDNPKAVRSQLVRSVRLRLHIGDIDGLKESLPRLRTRYPNQSYIKAIDWIISHIDNSPRQVDESIASMVASNPDNVDLLNDYAAVSIILKRYAKARTLLERAERFPQLQTEDSATVAVLKRRLNEIESSR